MSNRSEIIEEYQQKNRELDDLKRDEAHHVEACTDTITIEPKYGQQMAALSEQCSELSAILEAMDASEDWSWVLITGNLFSVGE